MTLFTFADNADRAGRADQYDIGAALTYRKIVHVFKTFIVLFEVFKGLNGDEDQVNRECLHSLQMTERNAYARHKVVYISRCLREGRVPVPGVKLTFRQ